MSFAKEAVVFRGLLVFLIIMSVALLCAPCMSALNYSVNVTPYPSSIIADSASFTTITAEVRDELGKSVPDGTSVDFTTSLGVIDRTGTTVSGTARARLQSGAVTGTATVTVIVRGTSAVNQTKVMFVAPGEELPDETFIDVRSADKGYVGYDLSRMIVEAAPAIVKHRGVEIRANLIQMDAERGVLRSVTMPGDPDIEIKRGDKIVKASALYYDFSELGGVILTPDADGNRRMRFSARDMSLTPDEKPDRRARFDIVSMADASMYIRADRLLLKPGSEMKIIMARVYFEGERVMTIPLHRIILGGGGGSDRMLSYGSEGLRLDIPFYYMLTPTATGAVRMKRSEQTGWGYYSETPGWQMDIEQDYNVADTAGTVALSRVGGSDWGMRWQQRQEYNNNSRMFTYLDFPQHRDVYGTIDYSRSYKDKTISITARGSKPKDSLGRMAAAFNVQTKMKPLIGKSVSALFSAKTTMDSTASADQKVGGGIGMQLYGMPVMLGGLASLTSSLAASQVWGGSTPGHSVYGNVGLYKQLGGMGSLTLNYNYIWESFSLGGTSQTVSADVSISPFKRISLRLSGVKSLLDSSTSLFGEAGYWMGPRWEFRVLGTRQSYQDYTFGDTQFVLVNYIGRQEARLVWSRSRKKFIFEFSTGGF